MIVASRDGVIVIFQEILEKFYQTVAPILEKEENARNFIIENSKNATIKNLLSHFSNSSNFSTSNPPFDTCILLVVGKCV